MADDALPNDSKTDDALPNFEIAPCPLNYYNFQEYGLSSLKKRKKFVNHWKGG